ncbi:MAG: tRNA (adenosine(37)-N6)-threonylcarbamoyltransferase complex dimerization subunit type 1 TsaB [Chitinophagaceae bacterium]|nr:tRNA (adenosine(37)-N6)-threonylcarbamoyltransferase complex dimerization subunit type 1 TsaB [Chitinophagaceae bacterium]
MALILHIDTALQQANVGISDNGIVLLNIQNKDQYSHASFVQPAIQKVLQQLNIAIGNIDAVGITAGPGSYTGLRVAMASAKGLCFALNKPLLAVSTLEVMAVAAIAKFPGYNLYCPMIDARRNEVYTALYTSATDIVMPARPLILKNDSFEKELANDKILFFGDGSVKWENIVSPHTNASFEWVEYDGVYLAKTLFNRFKNNAFENLAYSEPFYLKEFYLGRTP